MKKTDKKIENTLRISLTEVCEIAIESIEGFTWLTHLVDYQNFPDSLVIVCVFNTKADLSEANRKGEDIRLANLIKHGLVAAGIKLSNIKRQIRYDTEESCKRDHDGQWHKRLAI
jgi:hypothetical protein